MFGWTNKRKQTFEAVKRYITKPLILSSPKFDEELYIYLAVSDCVVSAVLF